MNVTLSTQLGGRDVMGKESFTRATSLPFETVPKVGYMRVVFQVEVLQDGIQQVTMLCGKVVGDDVGVGCDIVKAYLRRTGGRDARCEGVLGHQVVEVRPGHVCHRQRVEERRGPDLSDHVSQLSSFHVPVWAGGLHSFQAADDVGSEVWAIMTGKGLFKLPDSHVVMADVAGEQISASLHGSVSEDEVEDEETEAGVCCEA